ncbi:MAG: DegT/DnrJ/EryC1/StrS family aminotransferase, partial [Spirochaetaceae bacterium]
RFTGSPHALAVNSATAGLHLALEAVGVRPGDTVIVPSLTFTATAEVVRYLGGEVAFADITGESLLLDPRDVAHRVKRLEARGKRVAAIVPVHLAGEVCALDELREIARRCGGALVEDAAHAFPSRGAAGFAGTLGDAGVFSFYANKTITTGEGGMVCTADGELAARIRTMRTHGIDRDSWDRYRTVGAHWYYQVVAPGYKYNMPDTAAAIGRVQLRRAGTLLELRRRCAHYYGEILADLEREGLIRLPRDTRDHAWHLYIVRLAPGIDRDEVIAELSRERIGSSVHYIPLHRMPYWSERYGVTDEDLPRTAAAADRLVSLPLYPGLRENQQERVAEILGASVRRRRRSPGEAS